MVGDDVKSVVSAIASGFANGLNVLRKIRNKRSRRKKNDAQHLGYSTLSHSLSRGQAEVTGKYEYDFQLLGHGFATGDVIAQASLARTLLRLNTGLVNIISSFLGNDKTRASAALDYELLIELSEQSRFDTITALGDLRRRLSQFSTISRTPSHAHDAPLSNLGGTSQGKHVKPAHDTPNQQKRKKPSSSVALEKLEARGGLVMKRKKGASNTKMEYILPIKVTMSTTKLPAARPAPIKDPRKNASTIELSRVHSPSNNIKAPPRFRSSRSRENSTISERTGLAAVPVSTVPLLPVHNALDPVSPPPKYNYANTAPPPIPPKEPINIIKPETDNPRRRRDPKPTPSFMSFVSDSTKLGEIPEHKWATPAYFQRLEAANHSGYLANTPGGRGVAGQLKQKTKGRFWGLFGK